MALADIREANILVVDDEPINLVLLEEMLSIEGFLHVEYVLSPFKALETLEANEIDLILLDVKMPGMDGFEFIQSARQLKKDCPPILILTASADAKTKQKAIEVEVQGLISKPFDVEDILPAINDIFLSPL